MKSFEIREQLAVLIVDKRAYLTRNGVKREISLATAKRIHSLLKKKAKHDKN